jgi:2-desacetyl-2-hydroxyethyl bacteriochlorophyllide A dehydrogenase
VRFRTTGAARSAWGVGVGGVGVGGAGVKAVVAYGPGDFRLEDVPPPRPEAGAVLEIEAAGVCAADRMIWRGDGPWELSFPFTPGHEILGRVAEVDDASAERWGVAVGDRVTAEVLVPCRRCRWCRAGRTNLCRSGTHLGSGLPGAFAERMALPAEAVVHRVPTELGTDAAALVEPTACAVHAVRRAGIVAGDVVAVAGIGAIGAAALGAIRAAAGTCRRLLAVVTSPARAERARALGADEALDTSALDGGATARAAALTELAGGDGVDVFVDCSGSPEAVDLGLAALVPGGRLVLYGVYRRPATVDLNLIAEHKELDVRGGHLAPGAFPEAIELLRTGAVDAELIVTSRHPLDGVHAALGPSPGHDRLKALLVPHG